MRIKTAGLLLVVLTLILTACGGAARDDTGTITEGGELDVFSLGVGDCFGSTAEEAVASVEAVPCSEPHESEVYALADFDADASAEWPGQEAIDAFSDEACLAEFEGFVGMSYDESRYFVTYLQPTVETWADGDREVVCLLRGEEGEAITGSLRGIAE